MTSGAVAPATAQEHAVDALRRLIVSRTIRPGQRVNQEELAHQIGTSVAPVREALRVLEQEGQLVYRPRRGYFVTELRYEDLVEIYGLRATLEARAARHALPLLDGDALGRIEEAARACGDAAAKGDVAAELAANRRFHFAILDAPGHPHTLRVIRLLWDSTDAYRAIYYNVPAERMASIEAHERILTAIHQHDLDRLVAELDAHRRRALEVLGEILRPASM